MNSNTNFWLSNQVQTNIQKNIMPEYKNNNETTETKQQDQSVSSDASAASRAYGLTQINSAKGITPESLEYYLNKLKQQGKIEEKDYRVTRATKYDNYNLEILNKNGDIEKILYWCNGNSKDKFSGYNEYTYADNKLVKSVSKSSGNKVRYYIDYYDKAEIPQSSFTKEGIDCTTKPDEYIKYLEKNNIKFKMEKDNEENGNYSLFIDEFNKNGNKTQSTCWDFYDNKFGDPNRSLYNIEGEEYKRIVFKKDKTEVCTYLNVQNKEISP